MTKHTPPTEDEKWPYRDVRADDLYDLIAPDIGLQNEQAFYALNDQLFDYSARDQEGDPDEPGHHDVLFRRAEGYRLARVMRDNAVAILKAVDAIGYARVEFNDLVCFNPPLLEAILDIDLDGTGVFMPEEIDVLLTFWGGRGWDATLGKIEKMAALPVKSQLQRGPVPNTTLRRAVEACRAYWRDVEGNSWSMSSLKTRAVRDENKRSNLQGSCERFVAAALGSSGIRFTLRDLATAWTTADARERVARANAAGDTAA